MRRKSQIFGLICGIKSVLFPLFLPMIGMSAYVYLLYLDFEILD